jgi:hypothetical protein
MLRLATILVLLTTSWSQQTPGPYRNPQFGFTYKIPYGWVDRTTQMRDDSTKGDLLLAIFERPPEASGETVNAAVIIAAEPATSYPELKTAADYFGPLGELTASKGFKARSDPYEFTLGARQLPRADYTKQIGQLTMCQSSLVMLLKGQIVSFTFIAGSEDEVNQQIDQLKFLASVPSKPNASSQRFLK